MNSYKIYHTFCIFNPTKRYKKAIFTAFIFYCIKNELIYDEKLMNYIIDDAIYNPKNSMMPYLKKYKNIIKFQRIIKKRLSCNT